PPLSVSSPSVTAVRSPPRLPSWRSPDEHPDAGEVRGCPDPLPARDGSGGPRRAQHSHEDVLWLPDDVRRRAEHACVPGVPGSARCAAGGERQGDRVGDPDRPGAELPDRRVVPLRAEELLLPGHAEELPDLAVRRADRL